MKHFLFGKALGYYKNTNYKLSPFCKDYISKSSKLINKDLAKFNKLKFELQKLDRNKYNNKLAFFKLPKYFNKANSKHLHKKALSLPNIKLPSHYQPKEKSKIIVISKIYKIIQT